MKEQDIYKPLNLTDKERKQAGELQCFLRIAVFKNGLLADGAMDTHKMIAGIARLLGEREDLAEVLTTAVKLHEAIKENPLIGMILEAFMEVDAMQGGEDCQCPACTMMRATRGQKGEEN